ncbi:hypothetical protein [Rhodospira trueperi]|uniref:SWIM-type domain-containing protein n=1 Tax=Rhodospira trueperi TaxID=69960 RepID=A0A1G7FQ11_9PROT|nr:hypothetical protein [Rhodospira trueperi]SDE77977.1 hypothetical protein SAMN05421720_11221 [Rhodospira trueperi]
MTLEAMLAAHSDLALEGLASKGLLRRARRDHEAGRASVLERTGGEARVQADGQTVEIDGRGPAAARCDCPATGICRHILLAVLALRDGPSPPPDTPEASPAPAPPNAAADVAALPEDALAAFAGADLSAALRIAAEGASIEDDGAGCHVAFPEPKGRVTFIAGQGLAGAAYKGPKTRRRLYVTAAALCLRMAAGVALSDDRRRNAEPETPLDTAFCHAVADTVTRAVPAVLTGAADIAQDLLFDVAISARAAAAPRLAAHLRGLAHAADLAAKRDVAFDPIAFLTAAGNAYALVTALAQTPGDPALTGTLARAYAPDAPMSLWLLAAVPWQTASGARGLTVYGYAPETGTWHATTEARAAGIDPAFDAAREYGRGVWAAGTAQALMGRRLRLPAPRIAPDRQIARTLPEPAVPLDDPLDTAVLEAAGFDDWGAWRAYVRAEARQGLRRRATPVPAMLLPRRITDLTFDDLAQHDRLTVIDRSGAPLALILPPGKNDLAARVHAVAGSIRAIVVEARAPGRGTAVHAVSLIRAQPDGALRVVNLTLDPIKPPRGGQAALAHLRALIPTRSAPVTRRDDPLLRLTTRAMEAMHDLVTVPGRPPDRALIRTMADVGLASLSEALDRAYADPTPATILAVAYLASEVRAALSAADTEAVTEI